MPRHSTFFDNGFGSASRSRVQLPETSGVPVIRTIDRGRGLDEVVPDDEYRSDRLLYRDVGVEVSEMPTNSYEFRDWVKARMLYPCISLCGSCQGNICNRCFASYRNAQSGNTINPLWQDRDCVMTATRERENPHRRLRTYREEPPLDITSYPMLFFHLWCNIDSAGVPRREIPFDGSKFKMWLRTRFSRPSTYLCRSCVAYLCEDCYGKYGSTEGSGAGNTASVRSGDVNTESSHVDEQNIDDVEEDPFPCKF